MIFAVLGATILLGAIYAAANKSPRYARIPGWPNPPHPGPNASLKKHTTKDATTNTERRFGGTSDEI